MRRQFIAVQISFGLSLLALQFACDKKSGDSDPLVDVGAAASSDAGPRGNGDDGGGVRPPPGPVTMATLRPDRSTLFAGRSQRFEVIDPQSRDIDWTFSLVMVEPANAQPGQITKVSGTKNAAEFATANVSEPTRVIVAATNPTDSTEVLRGVVTILPLGGTFTLTPSPATIGLQRSTKFTAVYRVSPSVMFTLSDVDWRINGVKPMNATLGTIDDDGVYLAPNQMPDSLPVMIKVGYALSAEQDVQVSGDVTLAELRATPDRVTGLQPGSAGTISAMLFKSDNTNQVVPLADLQITSGDRQVVTVDAAGDIIIGDRTEIAIVNVVHTVTLARDIVIVHSRSDHTFVLEANRLTNRFVNIDRTEAGGTTRIEVVRPGEAFNAVPIGTYLRGTRMGEKFSFEEGPFLEFSGDGTNIITFDERTEALPDLRSIVGTIDKESGIVIVGDTPGEGMITATYDDGEIRKTATMRVVFSRLEITATATGERTRANGLAYTTELVNVRGRVRNPSTGFFGHTPLRVTLNNGDSFFAVSGVDVNTGSVGDFSPTNQLRRTTELSIRGSSSNTREDGAFRFSIAVRQAGMHSLKIESFDDVGAIPAELTLEIRKPPLRLGNGHEPTAPIVANNYVNIEHDRSAPIPPNSVGNAISSIETFYLGQSVFNFLRNDSVQWVLTDPAGMVQQFPATQFDNSELNPRLTNFAGYFRSVGQNSVNQAFVTNSDIESETLIVDVVEPQSVSGVGVDSQNTVFGNPVQRGDQIGAFQILTPLGAKWAPGVPIPVRIQIYGADGIPKAIGHITRRVETFSDPSRPTRMSETRTLYGVSFIRERGPSFTVTGGMPSDSSGIINAVITPSTGTQSLGVGLTVLIQPSAGTNENFTGSLPVEVLNFRDGRPIGTSGMGSGAANFTDSKNRSYTSQRFYLFGSSLAITPQQIPIASQRVRDAVAAGTLSSGAAQASFEIIGNGDFDASQSVSSADLGPNVRLVGSVQRGNRIQVTVETDVSATAGGRDVTFTLADGSEWTGGLQLFTTNIEVPQQHADKNLPLNARHHNDHPIGSQVFRITSPDSMIQKLDLELRPSIVSGGEFRGQTSSNPLVGFSRDRDVNGQIRISDLEIGFFQIHNQAALVYGDTTDTRRLDPSTGRLGPPGDPDGLPDFVSRSMDAELLIARLEGNVADVMSFSAYNLVAKLNEDLEDPQLGFDDLKADIDATYTKYREFDSRSARDSRPTTEFITGMNRAAVAVSVDSEAPDNVALDTDNDRFSRFFGDVFYAGMLDQYFLGHPFQAQGKDGRVDAFDGDLVDLGAPTTGGGPLKRRSFGVELDGAIYDPSLFGLDRIPNHERLRPSGLLPNTLNLTDNDLIEDIGGASGGYFDLDAFAGGSYGVVSRTPGSATPGLHAGHVITGSPYDLRSELRTPLNTVHDLGVEDDFSDVVATRTTNAAGSAAGEKLSERPRHVLGYATNRDKKEPIRTAFSVTTKFQVQTDPPGLDDIVFKAAVHVSERRRDPRDNVDLLVTTQSSGSEETTKVLLDTTSDLVINLASSAILGAVTGGGAAAICQPDYLGDGLGAALNLSVGLKGRYAKDTLVSNEHLTYFNGGLQDGIPIYTTRGYQHEVSLSDLINVEYPVRKEVREHGIQALSRLQDTKVRQRELKFVVPTFKEFALCGVLQAPFNRLKSSIKDSFSIEDLGGGGSATAYVVKTISFDIPNDARTSETGAFTTQTRFSRTLDLHPGEDYIASIGREDFIRPLSDFPSFDTDGALTSDIDVINEAFEKIDDPMMRNEATNLLIAYGGNGVLRTTDSGDYAQYTARFAKVPTLSFVFVPNRPLGDNRMAGDFELTTGETELPVVTSVATFVSRSNENATARARLKSNGIDVTLLRAIIPSPPSN